jgi:pimeloyl-ACP methyl ester carboxylesterase
VERFVDVPGGRLLVADDGDGLPILLPHAGIADLRAWDAMVTGLVDAGFQAIRHDARGHGRTLTDDVPFSNRADAIAVLDALGIGRAALVGNSRGGQIAIDTAIEFPDRVVALIPVGSGPGGFDPGIELLDEAPYEAEAERLASADPIDGDALADLDVRLWADGPNQPVGRAPAGVREAVREMTRKQYAPGHVSGKPIPLEPAADERLAELRCPVLLVNGSLDVQYIALATQRLEAAVPDVRVVTIPNVAHMVGMEVPAKLNELIVEFLQPFRPWS